VTATPRLFSLTALLAVFAVSCGPRAPDYDYSKEPNPRKTEFVIGVADELEISVWKKPELSTSTTVRPDGTVTMPLIGDVAAVGKTPSQLKQEIQRRISEYIKLDDSTTITVAVKEVNSYKFTVSGEVEQPGIHTSKAYVTVAEAIALAGGFTRFAKRDDITLMRRNQAGAVRRIPIVYSLIANGQYPEMNLIILPGDSIYVP
jgi:polysaccharide export outer membrane protein